MKDEIKEILESSRKIIKSNRENGFDRIIMLGDDIDKLLDYITNLQEENERLSVELNQNMIERNNYLSRNEKAIEYIEKVKHFALIDKVNIMSMSTLENILKGE